MTPIPIVGFLFKTLRRFIGSPVIALLMTFVTFFLVDRVDQKFGTNFFGLLSGIAEDVRALICVTGACRENAIVSMIVSNGAVLVTVFMLWWGVLKAVNWAIDRASVYLGRRWPAVGSYLARREGDKARVCYEAMHTFRPRAVTEVEWTRVNMWRGEAAEPRWKRMLMALGEWLVSLALLAFFLWLIGLLSVAVALVKAFFAIVLGFLWHA